MDQLFFIIFLFTMLIIVIFAVARAIETSRKYNDEPIPHLKCKHCGKPQIFAHRLDACEHEWIEG